MNISCTISIDSPELPMDLAVLIDDTVILETKTNRIKYKISHDIAKDESDHSLKFVLSGKTDEHTIFNDDGEIVKSAHINVQNISFDGIDITDILLATDNLMTYTHDGNGYTNETVDTFDPLMGYNGVAELKFSTPMYIWLLEHM